MLPGQTASDRPDLIARVFRQKQQQVLKDIEQKKLFGKVVGKIGVIEFQKRGLPHTHFLIWLAQSDKIRTAEETDQIIRAEFVDTTHMENGPEKDRAEKLNKLVSFIVNTK